MPKIPRINIANIASEIDNAANNSQPLKDEEVYLDEEERKQIAKEHIIKLHQNNETRKQNNLERKKYAKWIFYFTVSWLFFIMLIIGLCGFKIIILSDTVLIALITTSTINVLAFFTAVTLYLFNKDKST